MWADPQEPHSFVFIGSCVELTGPFVRFVTRCVWETGQPDCDISYRTFAKWAVEGTARWFHEDVCSRCDVASGCIWNTAAVMGLRELAAPRMP